MNKIEEIRLYLGAVASVVNICFYSIYNKKNKIIKYCKFFNDFCNDKNHSLIQYF
jgi:hypothetical protein